MLQIFLHPSLKNDLYKNDILNLVFWDFSEIGEKEKEERYVWLTVGCLHPKFNCLFKRKLIRVGRKIRKYHQQQKQQQLVMLKSKVLNSQASLVSITYTESIKSLSWYPYFTIYTVLIHRREGHTWISDEGINL